VDLLDEERLAVRGEAELMRRGAAAAAALALTGLWFAPAGAAPPPGEPVAKSSHCKQGYVPRGGRCVRSRKCRRSGLEAVVRTRVARVLVHTGDREEVWYGCLFSDDRLRRLRALDEPAWDCVHVCEDIGSVTMAGTYVALFYTWSFSYGGGVPEEGHSTVEIYDTRSGRLRREFPGYPTILLLAENGDSVAFDGAELWVRGRDGDDRLLDSGRDIERDSIRLEGRTVRWTKAGQAKEASF
jgi:hypothetical protein